jgi:PTH1 family peptidyl-tRNA hydrolase
VLHDFAKSDRAWLEPLLGAIAEETPYLAERAFDKFQSRVAHAMQTVAGIPQEKSPQAESAPRPRTRDAAARSGEPAAAETLGARLRRWFGS